MNNINSCLILLKDADHLCGGDDEGHCGDQDHGEREQGQELGQARGPGIPVTFILTMK